MIDLNKLKRELALVAAEHRMEKDPKKRLKLYQKRRSLSEQLRALEQQIAQEQEENAPVEEFVEKTTPEAGAALNPETKAFLNEDPNQQNGQQQSETKAENNEKLLNDILGSKGY